MATLKSVTDFVLWFSLLMVVPYSSVNMERLKDGNFEMNTSVNAYSIK